MRSHVHVLAVWSDGQQVGQASNVDGLGDNALLSVDNRHCTSRHAGVLAAKGDRHPNRTGATAIRADTLPVFVWHCCIECELMWNRRGSYLDLGLNEAVGMKRCRLIRPIQPPVSGFAGFRFPPEVILIAVRVTD